MSSHRLAPFAGQRYLNLESVKRDGTPVQTPVWFAVDHGGLHLDGGHPSRSKEGEACKVSEFPPVRSDQHRRSYLDNIASSRPHEDPA